MHWGGGGGAYSKKWLGRRIEMDGDLEGRRNVVHL